MSATDRCLIVNSSISKVKPSPESFIGTVAFAADPYKSLLEGCKEEEEEEEERGLVVVPSRRASSEAISAMGVMTMAAPLV